MYMDDTIEEDVYQREPGQVLWDVNKTAEYLGLAPKTVRKYIASGTVFSPEAVSKLGREYRIARNEVYRVAQRGYITT